VWNSNVELDGAGADWDIFFSRSTDGGATWSALEVLNSNAASDGTSDDYFPVAMTDGNGTWVAVWDSTAVIDGGGTDYDILFSRSTDDGVTWSGPHLLDPTAISGTGSDQMPVLMTDGSGTWVTVWRSGEDFNSAGTDRDIFFSRSTDNGLTWSASQLIDSTAISGTGEDRLPSVMTDGKGTWVTVWRSSEDFNDAGTDNDIFFSRSIDDGENWSASEVLNSANADSDHRPVVMTDGNGTWVTAWFSNEDLDSAGTDPDIFFSRSTDGGLTWSGQQTLNSNASTDGSAEDWHPVLMTDGEGTWIAAWNYWDGSTDYDLQFARSTDGGENWSTQQTLNSNAAQITGAGWGNGMDIRPILVPLGADIWTAVWQSNEDVSGTGTDYDIFFSRSINGGTSWSASQPLNSNAATDTGDEDDQFGDMD